MTTRVRRDSLLAALELNAAKHSAIVEEARIGYLKRARKALEERLAELQSGKIAALEFQLAPPQDYSEVYKSAIEMLKWTVHEVVELQADEFRQLVQDQWDWSNAFFGQNSRYSKTAWDWLNDSIGGTLIAPPE